MRRYFPEIIGKSDWSPKRAAFKFSFHEKAFRAPNKGTTKNQFQQSALNAFS
jgi:hypothetical protein